MHRKYIGIGMLFGVFWGLAIGTVVSLFADPDEGERR
jgi:gas vesicle protein